MIPAAARSLPRKTNPPCMKCKGKVSNVGSAGKRKRKYVYQYECHTCGSYNNGTSQWIPFRFTQIPPDDLDIGEDPQQAVSKPRGLSTGYKCSKCGLPKKGHTCLATSTNNVSNNVSSSSISSASVLPTCIFCEQSGTFKAGFSDTLNTCCKCKSMSVHFSCMSEFRLDWVCPACA